MCLPVRSSQNSKSIFHDYCKKEKQLLVIYLTLLGLNLISGKHLELIPLQFGVSCNLLRTYNWCTFSIRILG